MNAKYNELLDSLENDLDLLDANLIEWNRKYFANARRRYIDNLKVVEKYYNSGTILEVGSVPCHMTYCLKQMGYPLISVDLNPARGKDFIDKHGLKVIKCDIEQEALPFEDNKFDLILFYEIFEHLRIDPISTLRELARVLKPSGHLLLSTPNFYSLTKILISLRGKTASCFEEYKKLQTVGHMGHVREYSECEVREFLENTGFEIIEFQYKFHKRKGMGLSRDIFNVCFSIVPKWFRPDMVFVCIKHLSTIFVLLYANMLLHLYPY